MGHAIKVTGGKHVELAKIDTKADGGLTREEGEARFAELAAELGELQDLLYAAQSEAVLIILQGLDTSGKDGTIRNVFREVNPVGCRVASFKVPTPTELGHDFLWRVHLQAPARGDLVVFNRSHYEDVVVVRVHELVTEEVWRRRFRQINAFEHLLVESKTIVAKFYLHIGKEEQEQRLVEREHDLEKAWKLSAADWVERRSWDKYIAAYEDAIGECATPGAPWYVVPADRKWFRNLAIAEAIVDLLRPHKKGWLEALEARGETELKAIREARTRRSHGS
ncbi:MAG TPA: PPK2 family polyphosphate kinase [Thermomicrobiales bacterium]|jgi:PPK2 family polyphosphate:nucleotide phosphotransferase